MKASVLSEPGDEGENYEYSAMNFMWNSFRRPNISWIISFCGRIVVLKVQTVTYQCSSKLQGMTKSYLKW